jgi:hypothetical protein
MNNKWYNGAFFAYLGQGIALFLIIISIGTCGALIDGHIKVEHDKKEQKEGQ